MTGPSPSSRRSGRANVPRAVPCNKRFSEHLSSLNFYSKIIYFVINYLSQYDDNMDKEKNKDKNIDARHKWKVNVSVSLLKLLKSNDCVRLFHTIWNTIKNVETDKMILQFYVGYMSMSFKGKLSEKNWKTFHIQFWYKDFTGNE